MSMDMKAVLEISAMVTGANAVDDLKHKLTGAHEAAGGFGEKFKTLVEGIKTFGELAIFEQMTEMVKKSVESGEALYLMSKRTGIAVEELSKFQGAANSANIGIDQVAIGMKKLATNMVDAAGGNRQFSEIFKDLGISVRDSGGHIKNTGEVMLELADSLSKIENPALRSAVAVKLMGKSGDALLPMMTEGREGIEKFTVIIDSKFANSSFQFAEHMKAMSRGLSGFVNDIVGSALPAVNDLLTKLEGVTGATAHPFAGRFPTAAARTEIMVSDTKSQLDSAAKNYKDTIDEINKYRSDLLKTQDQDQKNWLETEIAKLEGSAAKYLKVETDLKNIVDKISQNSSSIISPNRPGENHLGLTTTETIANGQKAQTLINEKKLTSDLATAGGGINALDEFMVKQREAISQLQLETEAVNMSAAAFAARKDQIAFSSELEKLALNPANHITQAFKDQAQAVEDEKKRLIERNIEFKHTFEGGMQAGLQAVAAQAKDVGGAIQSALTNGFKGAEDAFVSFVQTGKVDFKSLIDSVIADLARAQFRAMASSLFGGTSGFNLGGFIGSLFGTGGGTNLPAAPPMYAMGTDSAAGGLSIVGENGPELVNLPRGASVTPNNKLNQAGGQTVIVNQTFTANANARELASIAGQIKNETIAAVYGSFGRGTLSARA